MSAVFTAVEGDALATLDALLGARVTPGTRAALTAVRPELLRVASQRLATGALRFLVESGGWRQRTVLRAGRRTTGRLSDAVVDNGFALRFTRISYGLWLEAARHLATLEAPARATREDEARTPRALARLVTEPGGSGDAVFYALAVRALGAFKLSHEARAAVADRLREGSVLALLLAPDACEPVAVRQRLEALIASADVRIFECAEDALVEAWIAHASESWASRADVALSIARWTALGNVLGAYVDAAAACARLDLTRAVMRFATALSTTVLAEGGAAVREAIGQAPALRDVAERAAYLRAVGRVVEVATGLFAQRDGMAAQRYGDDRYDEAQLFLRFVAESLAPARGAIDGLARGLSSTLG